jgi:hypothetical protein
MLLSLYGEATQLRLRLTFWFRQSLQKRLHLSSESQRMRVWAKKRADLELSDAKFSTSDSNK